ncbi:MAG: GDSL family lipase [Ruminococcaceae bacterium]|nr:GDSL family lipase [Oscillospiraceae bacterium]
MRLLFQGDSITDAGRDRRNYYHLGNGYPKYAAEYIKAAHPELDIEFINLGISGNRTDQLFDRLWGDAISLQPDIISILVGINDVWHRHGAGRIMTTDNQIEANYRAILSELKSKTNAKIVMLSPYLLDCEDKEDVRSELPSVIDIVRRLADEYADLYIPLDIHFAEALKTAPEKLYYSADGVHPNANGAEFIGKLYAEKIEALL